MLTAQYQEPYLLCYSTGGGGVGGAISFLYRGCKNTSQKYNHKVLGARGQIQAFSFQNVPNCTKERCTMGEQYWEPVQANCTVDDPETLLEPARGIYAKEMLCACTRAYVCVHAHMCVYVRERQGVEEGVGRGMLLDSSNSLLCQLLCR